MTYDEIYKHVTSNELFGVEEYILKDGQTVGISSGIRYLISFEQQAEEEIFQALERFYNADFGTMFESEYEKAFMLPLVVALYSPHSRHFHFLHMNYAHTHLLYHLSKIPHRDKVKYSTLYFTP